MTQTERDINERNKNLFFVLQKRAEEYQGVVIAVSSGKLAEDGESILTDIVVLFRTDDPIVSTIIPGIAAKSTFIQCTEAVRISLIIDREEWEVCTEMSQEDQQKYRDEHKEIVRNLISDEEMADIREQNIEEVMNDMTEE